MEHKGVWILAEQSGSRVRRISHELLTRGRQLADKRGADLTAVILGCGIHGGDLQGLIDRGADRVLAVEAPRLEHFLVEPYAACLGWLIRQHHPEIIIAGATSTGRTLMPYVAVKVRAGLTADCTHLDIEKKSGNLLQIRPAIGGNILATIRTPDRRPQMATVRPRSAKPAAPRAGRTGQVLRVGPPKELLDGRITRIGFVADEAEHTIQDADLIVSVGRGIKKGRNVPLVSALADAMEAALGASREVVDRGWLGYPHQVGLSGKTVSPRLYLAVGLSGSIQHLAGMQTAETIVAVNSDADAGIFQVADFGIVGDLFEVVPALTERINRARGR